MAHCHRRYDPGTFIPLGSCYLGTEHGLVDLVSKGSDIRLSTEEQLHSEEGDFEMLNLKQLMLIQQRLVW